MAATVWNYQNDLTLLAAKVKTKHLNLVGENVGFIAGLALALIMFAMMKVFE